MEDNQDPDLRSLRAEARTLKRRYVEILANNLRLANISAAENQHIQVLKANYERITAYWNRRRQAGQAGFVLHQDDFAQSDPRSG